MAIDLEHHSIKEGSDFRKVCGTDSNERCQRSVWQRGHRSRTCPQEQTEHGNTHHSFAKPKPSCSSHSSTPLSLLTCPSDVLLVTVGSELRRANGYHKRITVTL